jgi:bifunctional DNA-binding transcriptional regulator/antitoxin component of YhaV-PrlF toxin-antitoxin module
MAERMLVSRLDARGRTAVPKPVREALRLKPGDVVGFAIEGSCVRLVKVARSADAAFACFDEWSGAADRKGYASL